MGSTFSRVEAFKERSKVKERVEMINDFIYVLDPQEAFKDKKYVLLVEQSTSNTGPPNSLEGRFSKLQSFITQ